MHHPKDIEKLLKTLKRKTDRNIKYQDDVMTFLDFFNIKSGRTIVRYSVLKKLYYLWSKEPVSTQRLKSQLLQYLPYSNKGYHISGNAIDLSKKAFESMKEPHIPVIRQRQVSLFIQEKQIEPGIYFIERRRFYIIFKRWVQKRKLVPLAEDKFYGLMKLYIPYKQTESQGVYFGINQDLRTKKAPSNASKES